MLKQFKPITYVALHNCYYNDIFELIKNFFAAPQKKPRILPKNNIFNNALANLSIAWNIDRLMTEIK